MGALQIKCNALYFSKNVQKGHRIRPERAILPDHRSDFPCPETDFTQPSAVFHLLQQPIQNLPGFLADRPHGQAAFAAVVTDIRHCCLDRRWVYFPEQRLDQRVQSQL